MRAHLLALPLLLTGIAVTSFHAGASQNQSVVIDADIEIAKNYRSNRFYELSIIRLREVLAKTPEANLEKRAEVIRQIGLSFQAWDKYTSAEKNFQGALALFRQAADIDGQLQVIENLGVLERGFGNYRGALRYFSRLLKMAKASGRVQQQVRAQSLVADMYLRWGEFGKSHLYYTRAISLADSHKYHEQIIDARLGIGTGYFRQEQYAAAVKAFERACASSRKYQAEHLLARCLLLSAMVDTALGKTVQARRKLGKSMALARRLKRHSLTVQVTRQMAHAFLQEGDRDEALAFLDIALLQARENRLYALVGDILHDQGVIYLAQKKYRDAAVAFKEAVQIKERLRLMATGALRRDYLASQIATYRLLTRAHISTGEYKSALAAIEAGRSRYFAEQIGATFRGKPGSVLPKPGKDTRIVVYDLMPGNSLVAITVSASGVRGYTLKLDKLLSHARQKHASGIGLMPAGIRLRGARGSEGSTIGRSGDRIDFFSVIQYYRHLLSRPGRRNARIASRLGREIHNALLAPLQKELAGADRLVIVPDGVLAFLPFETLQDSNGKYLVGKHVISYVNSNNVYGLLLQRRYQGRSGSLLAFGGAVYSSGKQSGRRITRSSELAGLRNSLRSGPLVRGNSSVAYQRLGMGKWENLPGSLEEVRAIGRHIPGSVVYTGQQVSEKQIKALSASGELAGYRILHFATHAIVVPSLPELSALVLSTRAGSASNDGYLRMPEIAALKVQADFVNLSACETGLGKIYGGEGVVGLTQAFFIAGANAVSVSLWKVSDRSTSKFMQVFYRYIAEDGMDYASALARVKREFASGMHGRRYRSPFYWAPFVYYGVSGRL